MTAYARSGASFTWHKLTDRYGWVCGRRTRFTVCGEELLPERTQMSTEKPTNLCGKCRVAK